MESQFTCSLSYSELKSLIIVLECLSIGGSSAKEAGKEKRRKECEKGIPARRGFSVGEDATAKELKVVKTGWSMKLKIRER